MPSAAAQPRSNSHPCFYAGAKGKYGRIHLPVASSCNIQCAYCRRDHDCPHENRPGVAAGVISPEAALNRLRAALLQTPHISVAAVAGPGDAFCDPAPTLLTFEMIRREYPDLALCVSTNGLGVKEHIRRLCDLDVRFVTVTVNAVDPAIGASLHKQVAWNNTILYGTDGARMLLSRQIEAIRLLKSAGITVKINTVIVPGVNDDHAVFLARKMGSLGVDLMNFIPLIPVAGTDMETYPAPDPVKMKKLRQTAAVYVKQMHHCSRCRSDAAGFIGVPKE
ncbi:MAG TPA: radical SAM protein [Acidobacteriota bacterium]|nr:radical SAM protein [Acidobacteriota bacterium]